MKFKLPLISILLLGLSACSTSTNQTAPQKGSTPGTDDNLICKVDDASNWDETIKSCAPQMTLTENANLRKSLNQIQSHQGFFYPETLQMAFLKNRYSSLTETSTQCLKQNLCTPENLEGSSL